MPGIGGNVFSPQKISGNAFSGPNNNNSNLNPNTPGSFSSYGDPASFTAGATTQAGDYDSIMKQYQDLASSYGNNTPVTPSTIGPSQAVNSPNVASVDPTAVTAPYSQSADETKSLADLSNLATTGGYSAADKANILARDISPTRSIYANAQQNADRNRALSGGYSPNFNASQTQMSRDAANQISDTSVAANAGIAQNVAANELAASGAYASDSASINAEKTSADLANANITNQTNQSNANRDVSVGTGNADRSTAVNTGNVDRTNQVNSANANIINQINEANAQRNQAGKQAAIGGQTSLYGTTPALTNTFGNQVINAANTGQGQQQINAQRQRQLFGFAGM